jgi:hypothetical protein
MESGLAIRPTATIAETVLVRPEPAPVRNAVATTLAASRSVTATADSTRPTGHDPARNTQQQQQRQPQAQMTRELVIDPQTREVILKVVNARTGQVDHQVPDEALLRMRAYHRTLANGEQPAERDGNTDTEA